MHRSHIEYVVRKLHYFKTERRDDRPAFTSTGGWYMTNCVLSRWNHEPKFPGHKPMDNNPSMGVKEQHGISTVHCFSCKHKSGLLGTVKEFGSHAVPEGLMTTDELQDLLSYILLAEEDDSVPIYVQEKTNEAVPEDVLDCLGRLEDERAIAYAEKRGLTGPDVELFRLGYSERYDRLMFPIVAYNGRIPLVQGRTLAPVDVDNPKYKNFPRGVEKQDYLYGEHLITDDTETLVVVEGQVDVIAVNRKLRELGRFPKELCVGTMGSEPSEAQMEKIRRWAREVVPFGDNDSPGKLMNRKMQLALKDLMPVSVIDYPEGTDGFDPDRLGDRVIAMLDARKTYLEHRLELLFQREVST